MLDRARPETTLFVDARGAGVLTDRAHRELTPGEIERIAGLYRAHRAGEPVEAPGFAAVRSRRDIEEKRFVLTPARYVEPMAREAGEPARQRLETLSAEWRTLRAEADRLAREIEEIGLA